MNDVQEEYIKKLENVIKQIVSPLKVLPPEKVLELIYVEKSNLFDESKSKNKKIHKKVENNRFKDDDL